MREAIPSYSIKHSTADGAQQTVHLAVSLPGVADSSQVSFVIEHARLLKLHAPGRYSAEIPLSVDVEPKAQSVQFLKKKGVLKAILVVASSRPSSPELSRTSRRQEQLSEPQQPPEPEPQQPQAQPQPWEQGPQGAQHREQQQQEQQGPWEAQQQQGPSPSAATSRREQRDAGLYSNAAAQANRATAADCFAQAQLAQQGGDVPRAQRLFQKACKLDPSSPLYKAALLAANKASDERADNSASSSQQATGSSASCPPSGSRGGAASSSGDAGGSSKQGVGAGTSAAKAASSSKQGAGVGSSAAKAKSGSPRGSIPAADERTSAGAQPFQADGSKERKAEAGKGGGGRPLSQQQRRRQQQERDAEVAAAIAQARTEREEAARARKVHNRKLLQLLPPLFLQRVKSARNVAYMLSLGCLGLAALYCVVCLAPPAAPLREAAGGWERAAYHVARPLLFSPRNLLWQPTWGVALAWLVAAYSLSCCFTFSLAILPGSSLVLRLGELVMQAAFYPLLCAACGGSWRSLLGMSVKAALGWKGPLGDPVVSDFLSVLACLGLRLGLSWLLLPLSRVLLMPLAWLWRALLWRPTWWLNLPLAAAAFVSGGIKTKPGIPSLAAATSVASWWLLCGGWWAVAQLTAVTSGLGAALTFALTGRTHAMIRVFQQLNSHVRALPLPFLIARLLVHVMRHLVWGPPASGWTWVMGLAAGGLLYLHMRNLPPPIEFPPEPNIGQGSGRHHLRHEVPPGAPAAVARILQAKLSTLPLPAGQTNFPPASSLLPPQASDYFQVLGVLEGADDAEIRRAKRTLSLATHPDKIGEAPGASTAFNLVTEAAEALASHELRTLYLSQREARMNAGFSWQDEEELAAQGVQVPPEFRERMNEWREAAEHGDVPSLCHACGGLHFMRRTDRPPAAARQCDVCNTRHAVRNDELWFESAKAGLFRRTILMLYCHNGVVYDIGERGSCDGTLKMVHEGGFPLNSHINYFKMPASHDAGGAKRAGGSKKKGRRRN
ncbi:DnaJ subfamily C member 14 [Chlorella vulgaris]